MVGYLLDFEGSSVYEERVSVSFEKGAAYVASLGAAR